MKISKVNSSLEGQLKRTLKGLKKDLKIIEARAEDWYRRFNQQKKLITKLVKQIKSLKR